MQGLMRVANLDEIRDSSPKVVQANGQTISLFYVDGSIYAVDNRCPHMGFPLDRGTVKDGILTCHWHHARFDLCSGGTFDPWADDVRAYPVEIRGDEVWLNPAPPAGDPADRFKKRLNDGLKHNLRLVIAKSVVGLQATVAPDCIALQAGAEYGTRFNAGGWGPGLTILTAMANILPVLKPEDRGRALYQGLTRIANESAGMAPAFLQDPLETSETRPEVFKKWFRGFVEVRDQDGAERTLRTAVAIGLPQQAVADMIFSAITDHLYVDIGHPMDFANKTFELLDHIGWEHAERVLPSLVARLVRAQRSEEVSSWRHPVDVAQMLFKVFGELLKMDRQTLSTGTPLKDRAELVSLILSDDPAATIAALKTAVADGVAFTDLSQAVACAATRRIAQFHTANEFGDWDTVLHTFSYSNAVHQAMKRAPSVELLGGVFDGAMSVYLDRFLNMPPAAIPKHGAAQASLDGLLDSLNRQQQVTEVGGMVASLLDSGVPDVEIMATLGHGLVREDADFHTLQVVEAGFRQYQELKGTEEARIALIAVGRYLAAHCPTPRAMDQTYRIALRLHRGEKLYAG